MGIPRGLGCLSSEEDSLLAKSCHGHTCPRLLEECSAGAQEAGQPLSGLPSPQPAALVEWKTQTILLPKNVPS